ncbi:MAG: RluA family pseudouridine synthase, partial [Citrobacter sp.]|nr:RluA family pseudouridine synthase [Citrobacter sp.]
MRESKAAVIRRSAENGLSSAPTFPSGSLMSTIIDTFIAPPCNDAIEPLYQDDHLL